MMIIVSLTIAMQVQKAHIYTSSSFEPARLSPSGGKHFAKHTWRERAWFETA